jgi:TonB family protein
MNPEFVRASGFLGRSMVIPPRPPDYTEEALTAGLEGRVELLVMVGRDGVPQDIQVSVPLDAGLDQKAIECVRGSRFPEHLCSAAIPVRVHIYFRIPEQNAR